jgi:hypothetical protein
MSEVAVDSKTVLSSCSETGGSTLMNLFDLFVYTLLISSLICGFIVDSSQIKTPGNLNAQIREKKLKADEK